MKKLPVTLYKRSDGSFYPTTPADEDMLKGFKLGEGISLEWKKVRNYPFLKKYMALMWYAFDNFDLVELKNARNFDRFREEVIILSGHYTMAASIKGHQRAIADSISFANMEQAVFDQLYDDTISILLKWVFKNKHYTRKDIDEVMSHIIDFT